MGGDNYGLFKKTLELSEDNTADNTPVPRRVTGDNKLVKPRVDSFAQWFLIYGQPSTEMAPGMLSTFKGASKKCCGERSQVVHSLKGRLTKPGAVTDYNSI